MFTDNVFVNYKFVFVWIKPYLYIVAEFTNARVQMHLQYITEREKECTHPRTQRKSEKKSPFPLILAPMSLINNKKMYIDASRAHESDLVFLLAMFTVISKGQK